MINPLNMLLQVYYINFYRDADQPVTNHGETGAGPV